MLCVCCTHILMSAFLIMSRKSLFLIKNMLIGNNLARIKSYHDVVVCMVGGMVDIEFRGKGMNYMIDLGVV
jgi:hypothetical protein